MVTTGVCVPQLLDDRGPPTVSTVCPAASARCQSAPSDAPILVRVMFTAAVQECKHLIALGMPHMVKSEVVDNDTGKSVDSRSVPLALPARHTFHERATTATLFTTLRVASSARTQGAVLTYGLCFLYSMVYSSVANARRRG